MLNFPFQIKKETTKIPTKWDLQINPASGVRPATGLVFCLKSLLNAGEMLSEHGRLQANR